MQAVGHWCLGLHWCLAMPAQAAVLAKALGGCEDNHATVPFCSWGFHVVSSPNLMWKYSCSLPSFWESPPYVNVPCPMWMFPALCECSPSSVGIPRGACSSFKTGPNSMILVSIEREKSDLQDYVIRIWIESLLACVYSKWSIFQCEPKYHIEMYFQIIESLWKALLVYQMESESKSYIHQ